MKITCYISMKETGRKQNIREKTEGEKFQNKEVC